MPNLGVRIQPGMPLWKQEGGGQGREKGSGWERRPALLCRLLPTSRGRSRSSSVNCLDFFPLPQRLSASLSSILSAPVLSQKKTYFLTLPRCTPPPGLLIPCLPISSRPLLDQSSPALQGLWSPLPSGSSSFCRVRLHGLESLPYHLLARWGTFLLGASICMPENWNNNSTCFVLFGNETRCSHLNRLE